MNDKDEKQKSRSPDSIALTLKELLGSDSLDINEQVTNLFYSCQNELMDKEKRADEFELMITPEAKLDSITKKEVSALFDLSHQIIINPETEKSYTDIVPKTVATSLDATELKQTFKKFGKLVDSSSDFLESIKDGQFRVTYKRKEIKDTYDLSKQEKPEADRWIKSIKIDLPFYLLYSLGLTILLVFVRDPVYKSVFFKPAHWTSTTLLIFSGVFVCCLFISIIIYPTFSHLVNRSTRGQEKAGIRFLNIKGERADTKQIFIRSLCVPLSMFFFGYVPIFFGRRSLQDTVANTVPITVSD